MPYVKPTTVIAAMIELGAGKARLPTRDLLVRGFLSGALLGFATTLAFTGAMQTRLGVVGALIFPVGFVMIVLLGLELVTGNFALLPLALREREIGIGDVMFNWAWVFVGNLAGSLCYAWLFTLTLPPDSEMARQLMTVAESKTLAYEKLGGHGTVVAFTKGILCNWMVTLGVVMGLTSESTSGKVLAMWLPILTFFAQGFEHSVVNMFAIPAGMLVGARVSLSDWWLWNQLPVTVGNIVGGVVFTGLLLHSTYGKRPVQAESRVSTARPVGRELSTVTVSSPCPADD